MDFLANPPATVEYYLNGRALSRYSPRHTFTDNYLQINKVSDFDAGTYTVRASNGIGKDPNGVEKTIELYVYPLFPTLKIKTKKTLFKPGDDAQIPCEIRAYPPPQGADVGAYFYILAFPWPGRFLMGKDTSKISSIFPSKIGLN